MITQEQRALAVLKAERIENILGIGFTELANMTPQEQGRLCHALPDQDLALEVYNLYVELIELYIQDTQEAQ